MATGQPIPQTNRLSVKDLGRLPANLSVRVMDESGFVTETSRKLTAEMFQPTRASENGTVVGGSADSGCQSTGFGASAFVLLLALALLTVARRMKRSAVVPLLLVSVAAFGLSACDDGSANGDGCTVDTDCGIGEFCDNGVCRLYVPSDGDDSLDGDEMEPTDGDIDGDTDGDGIDCTTGDCPCETVADCPSDCYFCHIVQKVCKPKQCSLRSGLHGFGPGLHCRQGQPLRGVQ